MATTTAQRRREQSEGRQRFVRAANTRVNNALLEIAKIGKLYSQRYEYNQDDIDQIVSALDTEIAEVRRLLESRGATREVRRTIIEE
jgi:hypothetical protein